VLASTLIDGIDAVVTLGTDYLAKQSTGPATDGSAASTDSVDPTTAPDDTVAVDD